MKRDSATQNVILIRSAEDPDDFANYGGAGTYVPPLGTVLTGTNTPTKDNDSTPANNTPGEGSFEIIYGKASLNFNRDDDDKEASDVTTREIEHDPGKLMNEFSLEHWEKRGESRFGGARKYHPTRKEYSPNFDYPRYDIIVISFPQDSSGNPVAVSEAITKDDIEQCEKVIFFRDVIFKSKNTTEDTADKVRNALASHAIDNREYLAYEFGEELLASSTYDSTGSPYTGLGGEAKIPTRLKLRVTAVTTPGAVTITGKNSRGETISESVTIAAFTGPTEDIYRTTKAFSEFSQFTIATGDFTFSVDADELY